MRTQFWWIFDVLCLAIVLSVVYFNGRNGARRALPLSIGYIIASVLAAFGASAAAPLIYESSVRKTNIKVIEELNEDTDIPQIFCDAIDEQKYGFELTPSKVKELLSPPVSQFTDKLYAYVNERNGEPVCEWEEFRGIISGAFRDGYGAVLEDKMPGYVSINFRHTLDSDPDSMGRILTAFYDPANDSEATAEALEDEFSKGPSMEIVQIAVYFIIVAVVMLIAAIISRVMNKNSPLPLMRTQTSEHVVGGILGLVNAAALLICFTLLVRFFVVMGGGETLCFNDETIADTRLFHYLYDARDKLI